MAFIGNMQDIQKALLLRSKEFAVKEKLEMYNKVSLRTK